MKTYKYDVAISLLKQDVAFARKLIKALNPSLKVFFYEDRQEDLISKSGPEAFAKVFKDEARMVVILSRKEWSETFYTEIERNAIIDRIKEGYNFLMVLPMELGETPSWYPTSKIYVDPRNYSIEDIARFIEFKIVDEGGEVKPVTFEDRMETLKEGLGKKRALIEYLTGSSSVQAVKDEVQKLKALFNKKIQFIQDNDFLPINRSYTPFHNTEIYAGHPVYGIVGLGDKSLQIVIEVDDGYGRHIFSSQYYKIGVNLYKQTSQFDKPQILKQHLYRFNKTTEFNIGWSEEQEYRPIDHNDRTIDYMFRDPEDIYYYDLKEVITSEALIEYWFTELFKLVEEKFKPVLL